MGARKTARAQRRRGSTATSSSRPTRWRSRPRSSADAAAWPGAARRVDYGCAAALPQASRGGLQLAQDAAQFLRVERFLQGAGGADFARHLEVVRALRRGPARHGDDLEVGIELLQLDDGLDAVLVGHE